MPYGGSRLSVLSAVQYLYSAGQLDFSMPVTFFAGIRPVPYRETEHCKLTKQFLDRPEQMIKYLPER